MINLYPHQKQALAQTEGKNRVAYYLDMGLGKTFVGSEKAVSFRNKVLVVCQHSKIQDWIDHFTQNYPLTVFDLTKKPQLAEYVDVIGQCVGVINYDLIFRRPRLKSLVNFTLILDESSVIQNETRKRSKFVLALQPDNVVLLSGTPTGGKYERLWSQCNLLGWPISKDLYWKQYIDTEWVEQDGFNRKIVIGYKNVDRLKQKLAQHGAVFMKDSDAGIVLPDQHDPTLMWTALHPLYWKFLKKRVVTVDLQNLVEFQDDSDFFGTDVTPRKELIGDTTLTCRLYARQLCGMYNAARYEAFRDLVESTEDRLIVFYNFTGEYERCRKIVEGLKRPVSWINGQGEDLTAYEHQQDSVTFVQYQAGSMGKNLQKANKTIYFSLPESSELFEQSKKRTHRINQTRPCFYYILISPHSVEEDIYTNLQMRRDYTDELFRAYQATAEA